ncbi:hypothetical protein LCGC14_0565610 [marine sediment metagenome]|uniref:Uncharacterized protein n=1 Tax=marine sediment metagenome TaxID=412755 RepID=A0A0F9RQX4_9ZZZZ
MGFKQRLRKLLEEKDPKRRLQDPEKEQKNLVRVDPLERIAALKAADWDLTILLSRTGGVAAGATSKQWHISEVDPLTFYETIAESLGGGGYRMEFRKPDATLLRLDGSDTVESHILPVAGKPKLTGEPKEKPKKEGIDWMQEVMKEGSVVAMILKSVFEQRGKPDEVLMELLKTAISGNGNKADPTALLANVTDTVVKLKEAAGDGGAVDPMQYMSQLMSLMNQVNSAMKQPVVTTGSNSTGMDKFFESLGAAAPAIVPLIMGAMNKGGEPAATPSTLPANAPENVISMPQHEKPTPESRPEEKAAFAGTGAVDAAPDPSPGNGSAFNPLVAFNAPDLGGEKTLTPESAAFGAILKLRYMVSQQDDPLNIASEMVDSINLIQGAKRVEGVWENYIDDPGEAFDEFAPLIPEWLEHPEYRTECREAMVKALTDYFESDETDDQTTVGAEEIEIGNTTAQAEPTGEPPAEIPETPADDTVERTSEHEGSDHDSQVNG